MSKVRVSKDEIRKITHVEWRELQYLPDFMELEGDVVEEEKTNGACILEKHEKCPYSGDGFKCKCPCHTPKPQKIELPKEIPIIFEPKLDAEKNDVNLGKKINEIIRYLRSME